MKIAITTNLDKEIGPNTKGGTELFVYLLVNELSKRESIESIDVYGVGKNYFASDKVEFISLLDTEITSYIKDTPELSKLSQRRPDLLTQFHLVLGTLLYKKLAQKKYDIIHDNSLSATFMALSDLFKDTPMVSTLHTNFDSPSTTISNALQLLHSPNHYFVSLSKYQEKYIKDNNIQLNFVQHMYNGLDTSLYVPNYETSQQAGGVWIGRVSGKHNKGIVEAVTASKNAGASLNVVWSLDDMEFYEEHVKKLLNDTVHLLEQPKDIPHKNEFYAAASYLLYPIMWEEPFPNVILETLASGTPVIAFAKGSLPESIVDGETGFLVNPSDDDIRGEFIVKKTGIDGLVEAIQKMKSLSAAEYKNMRMNARKRVETNFSIKSMGDNYENLYKKLINQ